MQKVPGKEVEGEVAEKVSLIPPFKKKTNFRYGALRNLDSISFRLLVRFWSLLVSIQVASPQSNQCLIYIPK